MYFEYGRKNHFRGVEDLRSGRTTSGTAQCMEEGLKKL